MPTIPSDPRLPPRRLASLARSKNAVTRATVASNPNTPLYTLFSLAQEFPSRVRENPALPLLLMGEVDVSGLSPQGMLALLQQEHPPRELFSLALRIPHAVELRLAVATHAETPEWLLAELGHHDEPRIVSRIAAHPRTPPATLARLLGHEDKGVRQAAAENPHTPAEARDFFAQAEHCLAGEGAPLPLAAFARLAEGLGWAQHLAVRLPGSPAELRDRILAECFPLGHSSSWRSLPDAESFLENPDTTSEFLLQILAHIPGAARSIARHPRANAVVLRALAARNDVQLSWMIAAHPSCPEDLLLGFIEDPTMARWLARNPSFPAWCLPRLLAGADPDVRCAVAKHPHAPPALCAQLVLDPSDRVRRTLAAREDLPEALLWRLSEDASPSVRESLARNPSLPAGLLLRLAADDTSQTRLALLSREVLPGTIIASLREDEAQRVRNTAKLREKHQD